MFAFPSTAEQWGCKKFITCNFVCLKLGLVVCLISRISGKVHLSVWSFKPCVFQGILGKNELNVTWEVAFPDPLPSFRLRAFCLWTAWVRWSESFPLSKVGHVGLRHPWLGDVFENLCCVIDIHVQRVDWMFLQGQAKSSASLHPQLNDDQRSP